MDWHLQARWHLNDHQIAHHRRHPSNKATSASNITEHSRRRLGIARRAAMNSDPVALGPTSEFFRIDICGSSLQRLRKVSNHSDQDTRNNRNRSPNDSIFAKTSCQIQSTQTACWPPVDGFQTRRRAAGPSIGPLESWGHIGLFVD